jgi:hypothetical protein
VTERFGNGIEILGLVPECCWKLQRNALLNNDDDDDDDDKE